MLRVTKSLFSPAVNPQSLSQVRKEKKKSSLQFKAEAFTDNIKDAVKNKGWHISFQVFSYEVNA